MSTGRLFDDEDLALPVRDDAALTDTVEEPRLRTANRRQVQLRPVDLESLIPAEHDARAIWELLGRLDLSGFYDAIRARGSAPGRAATDPRILLCLWLYATSEGVGSTRELARLCDEHDAYRWICGGVSVNHSMLAEFRVGHGERLDQLMTQLLAVLLERGLVTLRQVAQDGTRVRASAGAASFRRAKTLKDCLKLARRQIKHVKKLADEDPARTQQRAAQERAAQDRLDRIEQAVKRLPEAQRRMKKDDEARVSTTDPDARVMKMADGGFRPAYNIQFATDVDSRVIVGVDVTTSGGDQGQLVPMLDQIEERLDVIPESMLVDGGYVKLEAIDEAEHRGVTVYAPVPKPRQENVDPHARKELDTDATAAWRARMATDDAKEIYKSRGATAETVNADLRSHRGLSRLPVRGLAKVTSIALLMGLTYNVLRVIAAGPLG
ncbi:MAG TPA: IS1182 family transposase [Gemmatimonadaceae bacterium]|nr:IS1182 family transposase [Gemmatimonadaceae bacterium]